MSQSVPASRLAIIDYGMGNLHSVASAISRVAPDVEVRITADPALIDKADRVIFPGVGAIRDCMAEIHATQVAAPLRRALDEGRPVLAVCVGMQALMERSEENGGVDCLGILPGGVKRFPAGMKLGDEALKVPHMGWNQVQHTLDHRLWAGIESGSRFYFVHSYYVEPADAELVAARCDYGLNFCSAMARKNLFATQFHPEKSHTDGLRLLQNFIAWNGRD